LERGAIAMNSGISSGVTIKAAVRTGQIVTFALTKGVIFFAVFAIVAQCPMQAKVLDRLESLARV